MNKTDNCGRTTLAGQVAHCGADYSGIQKNVRSDRAESSWHSN